MRTRRRVSGAKSTVGSIGRVARRVAARRAILRARVAACGHPESRAVPAPGRHEADPGSARAILYDRAPKSTGRITAAARRAPRLVDDAATFRRQAPAARRARGAAASRSLPDRENPRPGRHGRGVARRRHRCSTAAWRSSACCPARRGSGAARNVILREARRASQINDPPHRRDLRRARARRPGRAGDGVRGRRHATRAHAGADPARCLLGLATQCVEGMAAAHAQGVIHRDLKPENLMMTRGGQRQDPRLRHREARRDQPRAATTTTDDLSRMLAGTPHYMAPEAPPRRQRGRAHRHVLDGCRVLRDAGGAAAAFEGATYAAVARSGAERRAGPDLGLNPAVGPELSAVVMRMLSKDPEQRMASPAELVAPLAAARQARRRHGVPVARVASTPPAARPRGARGCPPGWRPCWRRWARWPWRSGSGWRGRPWRDRRFPGR